MPLAALVLAFSLRWLQLCVSDERNHRLQIYPRQPGEAPPRVLGGEGDGPGQFAFVQLHGRHWCVWSPFCIGCEMNTQLLWQHQASSESWRERGKAVREYE